MTARLKQIYKEKIVPELKAKLELENTMQVPRILKITINMGVGEAVADKKVMDAATADMAKISGPEAGGDQGEEVGGDVQGPRWPGHRLQGHAARRSHVRISGTVS